MIILYASEINREINNQIFPIPNMSRSISLAKIFLPEHLIINGPAATAMTFTINPYSQFTTHPLIFINAIIQIVNHMFRIFSYCPSVLSATLPDLILLIRPD